MRKHIARLVILGVAAVGYMMPDDQAIASAACKACTESGECINVSGGTTACLELSNNTCDVGGSICN